MKIRLIQAWGFSLPGDILDPDPPVAQLLIDRQIAERLADQQATLPAMAAHDLPPKDKMIHPPIPRKSRRRQAN